MEHRRITIHAIGEEAMKEFDEALKREAMKEYTEDVEMFRKFIKGEEIPDNLRIKIYTPEDLGVLTDQLFATLNKKHHNMVNRLKRRKTK